MARGLHTTYLYESPFDGSWATSTIYPDSSDTTSAGTDQVKVSYDRLGRRTSTTDQRQVVHNYSYDSAGRLSFDAVTLTAGTPATNVANTVLGIGKTYDDLSRVGNRKRGRKPIPLVRTPGTAARRRSG